MHPRVSVSEVSSWTWTFDEDLAFYIEAGIDRVGLHFPKIAALDPHEVRARLDDAGITVTNLLAASPFTLDDPDGWPVQRDDMGRILDAALVLRPDVVVLTTGAFGSLPWERAADAFADLMGGPALEAEREGLLLAIEHTHSLRSDIGFVHSLRDAIELGYRVDMAVCMEVNACWAERNLAGTISAAADAIALVQVSDHAIGTTSTPDRLVPGDGDLPLRRIVRQLLDAGYQGCFDIEIVGPRIEEEGYASAIGRSVTAMTELLDELLLPDGDDTDGEDGPVGGAPDAGDSDREGGDEWAPDEPGGPPPEWAAFEL